MAGRRIRDADNECVWRVRGNAFAHSLHDLQVDAKQIIAAHAGFARYTSGDDDHVGASNVGIIIGARNLGIEAFDGTALRQVKRLALGNAFNNVEQDDVAEAFQCCEVSKCAADITGANKRNFFASHIKLSFP